MNREQYAFWCLVLNIWYMPDQTVCVNKPVKQGLFAANQIL